jgi:hypothetical protein
MQRSHKVWFELGYEMKRKYEYIEGPRARKNFEEAMTAIFRIPKDKVPRPQPKKRTKRRKADDKG